MKKEFSVYKSLTVTLFFLPIVAFADCSNYPSHLIDCSSFSCKLKHPFAGQMMEKKVIGLEGDKCKTTEEMPNNGKMDCTLGKEMRVAIAKYLENVTNAKSTSTKVSTNMQSTKTTYKIDGKEVSNPLQEAMNNGNCKVSGY